MPAYVISEVDDVRDPAAFEAYRAIAAKTIIVVEFPAMERLREWYASPEYAEALKVRQTAFDRRLVFVEGVPPA
jgi:uncharacterized protein (DUF1330 family)